MNSGEITDVIQNDWERAFLCCSAQTHSLSHVTDAAKIKGIKDSSIFIFIKVFLLETFLVLEQICSSNIKYVIREQLTWLQQH